MRSNLGYALLAARVGTASRRSLDLVWAALTPFERVQLEREVDVLAGHGVQAVLPNGRGPLFYAGPYQAIGPQVLAVCGAREARDGAVGLAELAGRLAAEVGATVIAGDTEGPETAAVAAALDAGGLAVTVLAEGFRPHDVPAADARHVTVSPCAPGQPWSVDAAMVRNAAIAELCTVLVAVGAGSTGATLDAGMQALASGRPVLAVGATAGSRLLVDYGATAAADELELTWWLNTRLGARQDRPAAAAHTRSAARQDRAAAATRVPANVRRCDERPASGSRAAWSGPARRWSTA